MHEKLYITTIMTYTIFLVSLLLLNLPSNTIYLFQLIFVCTFNLMMRFEFLRSTACD